MLKERSKSSILQPKLKQEPEVTNDEDVADYSAIRVTSARPLVFLFTVSLLLLMVSLYFLMFVDKRVDNWPLILISVFGVWVISYLITSKKAKNSYFLISSVMILVIFIFHLSHVGLQVLGVYDFQSFTDKEMGFWHQGAGWLVMLAMCSFGIGFSFTGGAAVYNIEDLITSPNAVLGRSLCWWYGVGLFLAAMLSLVLLIYTVGNILVYSRSQIFGGVGDTRGFGLFQMFLPSSMILLMLGATSKKQKYLAYGITVFFGLGLLLMGYRSLVMFPALIGVVLWVKTGRDLNKFIIVPGLIFLLIAIPTVRHFRQLGSYEALTSSDLSSSVEQARIDDIFIELGGTSNIVAYVMKWVPEEENYRYGYTYWLAIKNTLPNLGFNISDSGRSIIKDAGVNLADLSASDWFIYRYNRWMFDTGGGAGFSMVAEPYLNFGVPGLIVFFILLGFTIGKLDSVILLYNPVVLLISSAIIWPLIKAVRNDFSTFMKPASFILIVIFMWKLFTFWKKFRSQKIQIK